MISRKIEEKRELQGKWKKRENYMENGRKERITRKIEEKKELQGKWKKERITRKMEEKKELHGKWKRPTELIDSVLSSLKSLQNYFLKNVF